LLWEWANEPGVRRSAFNQGPIDWPTHVAWFDAHVHSARCVMYIVETPDGIPVGQVRFDVDPGVAADVDVSLATEWRGQALAAEALRLACDAYHEHASETLVARVRPDNRASLRAFERAGFQVRGVESVRGQEAVRLECRASVRSR
jgi:RimJ/RimL family protein N-acetyltransferase